MGKHFNWSQYDSWKMSEPEYEEPLTDEEREARAMDAEDYGREAAEAADEYGPSFRPARRVRLFDER